MNRRRFMKRAAIAIAVPVAFLDGQFGDVPLPIFYSKDCWLTNWWVPPCGSFILIKHKISIHKHEYRTLNAKKILFKKEIENELGDLKFAYLVEETKDCNRIWLTDNNGDGQLSLWSPCRRSCIGNIFISDKNVDQEFIELVGIDESYASTLRLFGDKYRV